MFFHLVNDLWKLQVALFPDHTGKFNLPVKLFLLKGLDLSDLKVLVHSVSISIQTVVELVVKDKDFRHHALQGSYIRVYCLSWGIHMLRAGLSSVLVRYGDVPERTVLFPGFIGQLYDPQDGPIDSGWTPLGNHKTRLKHCHHLKWLSGGWVASTRARLLIPHWLGHSDLSCLDYWAWSQWPGGLPSYQVTRGYCSSGGWK